MNVGEMIQKLEKFDKNKKLVAIEYWDEGEFDICGVIEKDMVIIEVE